MRISHWPTQRICYLFLNGDNMTQQRIAVITGAARGIGLAVTSQLLNDNYQVVMVDRDADALLCASGQFSPSQVMTIATDLADPDAPAEIERAVSKQFGTASVLINNAGIAPKHDGRGWNIVEITLEEWHQVLDVNLTAAMLMCKTFLPGMQRQKYGRIVNVSSSAGRSAGVLNGPAYMASKAGLLGLTRHIAGNFGRDGITANTLAPGRIITPLSSQWSSEQEAAYNRANPCGRSGTPEEAAAAIAYLVSENAGFTNGAVIDINGGTFMA
jgi:3-oxoacyl-[acyl-carrier protein] reductase